jgi:short-subunit dehydrogenase
MQRRGTGHIVNVSAGTGKIGLSVTSGYSASKFALSGFSEALHREFLGTRIRVSCLHPGNMRTEFWNEESIPKRGVPPLVRYAPKMSPESVARNVLYCILFGLPTRTLPVFVGLLTRVNALWLRLGDLMLWKWFVPLLIVVVLLLILF